MNHKPNEVGRGREPHMGGQRPTLPQLPSPPAGRTGWPWTEESPQVPEIMPNGQPWPRISIVTPSYNQGEFIEETIRSVLLQSYPNLEYIILDGGSTDATVEIIKKYERYLSYWASEPDGGQAAAINAGLGRITGEWFNWLNSDDILMPRALISLAEIACLTSDTKWISGGSILMSATGAYIDIYMPWFTNPAVIGLDLPSFPQDATFIKTELLKSSGITLEENIQNVFDTLLHWELMHIARPMLTKTLFSGMRQHPQQKTRNIQRLSREHNLYIKPLHQKLPVYSRIILRSLSTRFAHMNLAILRAAVAGGLTPSSCQWKAAAYVNHKWDVIPARNLMR